MTSSRCSWTGVFPAVTTQFKDDGQFTLDLDATAGVIEGLIRDGVSGLIICGTVGEGCSLTPQEKRSVYEMAKSVAARRVPVIGGVAEYTTPFAIETARAAEKIGLDGVMVMPALVYSAKPFETVAHYRAVGRAVNLPIMVYNNPPIYRIDVTPRMLADLADVDTIVCFKESSGDTRRFIDLQALTGDRFTLFAGLDDVVLESIAVGAEGWVSGLSNVFPREGETLFRLAMQGRFAEAMAIYRWFMQLLHLDARPDLVQCIKLCEKIAGRGSALTRPPRLALTTVEEAEIRAMMETALATRPALPEVGLARAA
ncbi:dihydrodipicolinate synthase family protein [Nordella sp. HKS 07]|uniref:dihydrodipicolinate synthase family protein n=1 Tax=Nordella sp. HKS 07 TaxID=2712222 RepID=UPI0013E0F8B4|nr:dihydrodipicolinate synthase family protein [Nordella sp. HKS 07]QIG48475.1 dihydrodipicolinate synthase family protein [Nordella sp. HKS 07]